MGLHLRAQRSLLCTPRLLATLTLSPPAAYGSFVQLAQTVQVYIRGKGYCGMLNKNLNFQSRKSFLKERVYRAIASKRKTRSWVMKSKPPATVLDRQANMSTILESVAFFIHQVMGREM